jgi:RNA polymerase sigma factor (sigma-70 family)
MPHYYTARTIQGKGLGPLARLRYKGLCAHLTAMVFHSSFSSHASTPADESSLSSADRSEGARDLNRWFETEIRRHETALRNYLRARFPAITDIDDVIQESYIRILRLHSGGQLRTPKSALFTIARNQALDLIRRRKSSSILDVTREVACAIPSDSPDVRDLLAREQESVLLDQAITRLAPACRDVLRLCHRALKWCH